MVSLVFFFFFFQAEDGIRDVAVTGVQTCALPISRTAAARAGAGQARSAPGCRPRSRRRPVADARRGRALPRSRGLRPGPCRSRAPTPSPHVARPPGAAPTARRRTALPAARADTSCGLGYGGQTAGWGWVV